MFTFFLLFCRELDHVTVVGIAKPVKIYEVMQSAEQATDAQTKLKTSYEAARQLYCERKFELALKEVRVRGEERQKHERNRKRRNK